MKRLLIGLTLLMVGSSAVAQWGHNKDWMDLIDQSCSPTFKGKAKRMFGELKFWQEVHVSMEVWAEEMVVDDYSALCRATYPHAEQTESLMRCLASVKRDIDWFSRCKSPVTVLCRQAGGRCNTFPWYRR